MRYTGYDPNNIARVWAEDSNADIAKTQCVEEAKLYIARRPDTGPFVEWTFTHKETT
jgi:hypothetical protein